MVDECAMGVENKTRIESLKNDIDGFKKNEFPAIKVSIEKKVSSIFVTVGVFVLAGILGAIYYGQRDISRDITTIKIEQSKVTGQFELHDNRLKRIDSEIIEIKKKIRKR